MSSAVLAICAVIDIIFMGACLMQLSKHATNEKKRLKLMYWYHSSSIVLFVIGAIAMLRAYYGFF